MDALASTTVLVTLVCVRSATRKWQAIPVRLKIYHTYTCCYLPFVVCCWICCVTVVRHDGIGKLHGVHRSAVDVNMFTLVCVEAQGTVACKPETIVCLTAQIVPIAATSNNMQQSISPAKTSPCESECCNCAKFGPPYHWGLTPTTPAQFFLPTAAPLFFGYPRPKFRFFHRPRPSHFSSKAPTPTTTPNPNPALLPVPGPRPRWPPPVRYWVDPSQCSFTVNRTNRNLSEI